jgi:hypothetical protein
MQLKITSFDQSDEAHEGDEEVVDVEESVVEQGADVAVERGQAVGIAAPGQSN